MEEIMTSVSQVGFPIVVALYSLIRLEKTIRRNTDVMIAIAAKMDVNIEGGDDR